MEIHAENIKQNMCVTTQIRTNKNTVKHSDRETTNQATTLRLAWCTSQNSEKPWNTPWHAEINLPTMGREMLFLRWWWVTRASAVKQRWRKRSEGEQEQECEERRKWQWRIWGWWWKEKSEEERREHAKEDNEGEECESMRKWGTKQRRTPWKGRQRARERGGEQVSETDNKEVYKRENTKKKESSGFHQVDFSSTLPQILRLHQSETVGHILRK